MKFLFIFGFLFVSIEGTRRVPLPEHVANITVDGRIVNGLKAVPGQFPHLVSLRRQWTDSHFCGGSIISEKWILTAGHCMFRNSQQIGPSTFYVVAGEVKLNGKSQYKQMRSIQNLFIHSEFHDNNLVNDIALLLVDMPFRTTEYVKSIELSSKTPVSETQCVVAGWGYLREGGMLPSNDLMYLDLPVINQVACKKLLGHLTAMNDGQVCAGYIEGKKDACQGDSGGPFMCQGAIAGVVSGGYGCARPNLPGWYTNVAYYKKWILEIQTSERLEYNSTGPVLKPRGQAGGSGSVEISALLISTAVIYSIKLSW